MKRRSFLKGAAAAAVIATVPFKLGNPKERIVELDTDNGWVRIEMNELRPGDVFRVREGTGETVMAKGVAAGDPYQLSDRIWGIQIKA